jgi:hypothetical protein
MICAVSAKEAQHTHKSNVNNLFIIEHCLKGERNEWFVSHKNKESLDILIRNIKAFLVMSYER